MANRSKVVIQVKIFGQQGAFWVNKIMLKQIQAFKNKFYKYAVFLLREQTANCFMLVCLHICSFAVKYIIFI